MNILVDIGHPAHVHLFKNLILFLQRKNHNVIVVTRNKESTNSLLDYYNIDYICLSNPVNSLWGFVKEFFYRLNAILKLNSIHHFDLAIGTSVIIGYLTLFQNIFSINFNEDDDNVVPLFSILGYPFCSKIINPSCLKFVFWKGKRDLHHSYHELAYLHPNNFTPDKNVLKKYKLKKREYIVVRFSALSAHHDLNARGINKQLWNKILPLIKNFEIIKSFEGEKTHSIKIWDMHHILAFSKLVISDSQTMTAEAAVLGVPSVRINTFVGRISYLEELEHVYTLTYGFKPDDIEAILEKITYLLSIKKLEDYWKEKQNILLNQKEDFNKKMKELVASQLN